MSSLTKEELVGELLVSGQIDAEEAITLLTKPTELKDKMVGYIINPFNYTTTTT